MYRTESRNGRSPQLEPSYTILNGVYMLSTMYGYNVHSIGVDDGREGCTNLRRLKQTLQEFRRVNAG
ncbi:hypothetical protein BDV41DRAFT_519684 [Aspergillus transmontanensis]|uniref:Uncharacterized protein n=1 Tax=Aspergillus transmontanensis TaxID=1034304 RepID=A0A5N6WIM0_9EURO|nr:hypothetical protein BDV41DRAFT_519684 [Aspergillus transmontanensis]